MNILIINASPRKNGNSAFIAKETAEKYAGENVELIHLSSLNLRPCTACRSCKKNNSLCVIKDDMEGIYPKLLDVDRIIFISPNIFGFLSSLGKIFTDRFFCLKTSDKKTKFNEGKKLIFILTQGSPNRSHADMTLNWAKNFFEHYGIKTYPIVVPNCSSENLDGVKLKIDEIKMNISMF